MNDKYFKLFFYFSLIFLIIFVYKFDYATLPKVYSVKLILLSVVFLLLGFLFNIWSWTALLKTQEVNVDFSQGASSVGLSIFGKYIPGKIWVIMGRGEYIARIKDNSKKDVYFLSFEAQIFSIWSGLIIGCIGLLIMDVDLYRSLYIAVVCIVATVLVFTPAFNILVSKCYSMILRKKIIFPRILTGHLIKILPLFLLGWFFWSIGFYFFADSFLLSNAHLTIAFSFALAGSLGILMFTPGGLGVREGVLTGYLIFAGINLQDATTIALFSRIWFLSGELFVFILGLLCALKNNDKFLFGNRSGG